MKQAVRLPSASWVVPTAKLWTMGTQPRGEGVGRRVPTGVWLGGGVNEGIDAL